MNIEIGCNASDEILFAQVEQNSKLDLEWLKEIPAHDGHAVIVGGGPSIGDPHIIEYIRKRKSLGQKIFALNKAAVFLREQGIEPDYQVVVDSREVNKQFILQDIHHLFASQVHPSVIAMVPPESITLWHWGIDKIENYLPKRETCLIGGSFTVGLTAMCLAYTMGYRKLHLFGYDSSMRGIEPYAYEQKIVNPAQELIAETVVDGVKYYSSLSQAIQAENFQPLANAMIDAGCIITVDGDGLIPAIRRAGLRGGPEIPEQEKYRRMWAHDAYRHCAPGEHLVDTFIEVVNPKFTVEMDAPRIIDFGCGTGRAGLAFAAKGFEVLLMDFAENSRDKEAEGLTFIQHDLTEPSEATGDFGFCTDVMEHLPRKNVEKVIRNIMQAVPTAFFQISTVPDAMGSLIGQQLHLTVRPHGWWKSCFERLGYKVTWEKKGDIAALFVVSRN